MTFFCLFITIHVACGWDFYLLFIKKQYEGYSLLKYISRTILRILGWKLVGEKPIDKKFVAIGVPHTSNWDFPVALTCFSAMGIKFNWVGKESLFKGPLKYIFKWIGGIPLNRRSPTGFLKDMAAIYAERESLVIAIAPEGTRSKTDYWMPGFYYIANEAKVPIVLAFADYSKKTMGIAGIVHPTGDIEVDFEKIKEFYEGKVGKNPENQSALKIKVSRAIKAK